MRMPASSLLAKSQISARYQDHSYINNKLWSTSCFQFLFSTSFSMLKFNNGAKPWVRPSSEVVLLLCQANFRNLSSTEACQRYGIWINITYILHTSLAKRINKVPQCMYSWAFISVRITSHSVGPPGVDLLGDGRIIRPCAMNREWSSLNKKDTRITFKWTSHQH